MAKDNYFPNQQEQQQQQQQQQQQPAVYPQAASGGGGAWHSSGSIGPFFAVISVIAVLTVLSCVFSRFCVGSNNNSCRSSTPQLDSRYANCFCWMKRKFSWWSSHDIEIGHKMVLGGEQQGNKNGKSQGTTETAAL